MTVDWVVMGGAHGETAHCKRCGAGLSLGLPVEVDVMLAASKAFITSHKRCRDTGRTEPAPVNPLQWLAGRDTGTSSRTIWSVMMGVQVDGVGCHPWDPPDFGRCHRLLKLFPEWRGRLGEVAARYPSWSALVREWDHLTALYEEEEPSGSAPKLYAEMKRLIPEVSR